MKKNAYSEVLQNIRSDIFTGLLKPRERLIEEDLLQRYNTSRGTIRNVLKELDHKKVIKNISNRGATISQPSKKEMADIFGVRLLIENSIIEQIVDNMNDAALNRIVRHHRRFKKAIEKSEVKNAIISNMSFHNAIFESSGNTISTEIIADLRARSYLWQHYILGDKSQLQKTIVEHGEMIDCIKNQDASGLRFINEAHLKISYETYISDILVH